MREGRVMEGEERVMKGEVSSERERRESCRERVRQRDMEKIFGESHQRGRGSTWHKKIEDLMVYGGVVCLKTVIVSYVSNL